MDDFKKNNDNLDTEKRLLEGLTPPQSSFLKWLTKKPETEEVPRKETPHIATIDFNIKFRYMEADGEISPQQIPTRDVDVFLNRANMSDTGSIHLTGASLNETIQKVDKVLRLIDEQNKRR